MNQAIMNQYVKPLADTIKRARGKLDLTQDQVADISGVDTANIAKMENASRNPNPELATLFPVVRALNIDPSEIFYPEMQRDNPRIKLLQQLVSGCTDSEADTLIPIIRELIRFMRSSEKTSIKKDE